MWDSVKYQRDHGYYCNNICFDAFVKLFLLGGICGRDVWLKGEILYKQRVMEFSVERVRYQEPKTSNEKATEEKAVKSVSADWIKDEIEKLEEVYECDVHTSTGLIWVEVKPRRLEKLMVLRATISNLVDADGVPIGAKFVQEHTEPRDCFCC